MKRDDVALRQAIRAIAQSRPRFGMQVDNGAEFQSKVLDGEAFGHVVTLDFICPGKPVDNCFIESFNARLCDECCNVDVLSRLPMLAGRSKHGESTTTMNARTAHRQIAHLASFCGNASPRNQPPLLKL